MNKEGHELVTELNLTIKELTDKNDCISRQRDSVIDQATILKNERNSLISQNRELHLQLRDLQEKLDKIINKLLLQKNFGKNMKGGERAFSERVTDALICIITCNMSNNYFGTNINCGLFCGMGEILLE